MAGPGLGREERRLFRELGQRRPDPCELGGCDLGPLVVGVTDQVRVESPRDQLS